MTERQASPISREAIEGAINAIGNNPLKMLTLVALASAAKPLSSGEMGRAINNAQETSEGWILKKSDSSMNAPTVFCQRGLMPAGFVTTETIPVRNATRRGTGYRITQEGMTVGLAVAGTLLDWSLRYSRYNLQDILGANAGGNGLRRNVATGRLAIYKKLLAHPSAYVTRDNIFELERDHGTLAAALLDLNRRGVIDMTGQAFDFNRRNLVLLDSPGKTRRPSEKYNHEADKIMEALSYFYRKSKSRKITGGALLSHIAESEPDVNLTVVRELILRRKWPFLEIENDPNGAYRRKRITVAPFYMGPIASLLRRFDKIGSSLAEQEKAHRRAFRIFATPEDVAKLMVQARRGSKARSKPTDYGESPRPGSITYPPIDRPPAPLDESYQLSPYGSEWFNFAACAGEDPDLFYPGLGAPHEQTKKALGLCASCEVKGDCLLFDLENSEPDGGTIAGGFRAKVRRLFGQEIHEWLRSTRRR